MKDKKKTLLITGGAGFLGRNLGLFYKDKFRVVLASRSNKQNFIASKLTGCICVPMDVTNIESVRDVVNEFKPHIIVHAAATKFVNLSELYPMECVDVNILGSQNIARVAVDKSVEIVIGISTDKASPPIRNMYGMSKAVMERVFCSMNSKAKTRFACVRYGNVAWSTGSVLPDWEAMWEKTKVIGTTGPEMRRFFFTVKEAVQLVDTALKRINTIQGKVLSREMRSAQIEDILKIWTKYKGGEYKKIKSRPGERLDEYLIGEIELPFTTKMKIKDIEHYLISFNQRVPKPLTEVVSSANAKRLSEKEILNLINHKPLL